MEIQKKTIQVSRSKLIKPAHYKDVDTGMKREVAIIDEHGNRRIEERPIIEKEVVEATRQQVTEDKVIYCIDDGVDCHEFCTEEDAKRFLGVK